MPLHLRVSLTLTQHGLELRIDDNGIGLAGVAPQAAGSGNGLALHSTMMAVAGGTLTVMPRPESGTSVALVLSRELWLDGEGATD